jgi:hypothetical protein
MPHEVAEMRARRGLASSGARVEPAIRLPSTAVRSSPRFSLIGKALSRISLQEG